ncbi:MAG: rhodanese-like domain-containing protein [Acidocella sp.]|nr:rhodanese-like domain-containing protein [Acidocella sp.]MDE8350137.1 rhodanese-like domain-containing protein [Acidocella sp.]
MAKRKMYQPSLSALAVIAAMVPCLPAAVSALTPFAAAEAATTDASSLAALAQMVVRGEDSVSPDYVRNKILAAQNDFILVDLRDPSAFAAGHIEGAINVPLTTIFDPNQIVKLRRVPQVIVYGNDTGQAAETAILLRVGGVPAMGMLGGLGAWTKGLDEEATGRSAAIVRALNNCPDIVPAAIPPLNVAVPAGFVTAPAPSAPAMSGPAPAKPKAAPIQLNGTCG